VIILSSAGGRDAGRGRESGNVVRFLVKPPRRSLLFDAIATAIGSAPLRSDPSTTSADTPAPATPGGCILVAEDNPVNQRFAILILQKAGYRVDAVANGAEAVEAVAHGRYDAVLMDCEMPIMDGYAAAAEIRRHESGAARIPIIAISANAMKGDAERAISAGMDAYVTKPIDRHELYLALARLLEADTPSDVAPTPNAAPVVPAVSVPENPALDPSTVAALRELGVAEFEKLVGLFLKDGAARVAALRNATKEGDAHEIAEVAHSLKGSSGTIGATELADICRQLQAAASSGGLATALPLIDSVGAGFDRASRALREELQAGSEEPLEA
jgi:CheY-like chemotaxis protein/HPt (histidine-containing phosphotransfer) domain-containing protein